jgi:divalent metal cation (Fe/Co/Zn/Cd) transporter
MRGVPERPDAEAELKKAHLLAWSSIAYICSTIVLLFFVMSGSQALKTEMTGEILSLIPPTLFLIGDRVSRRPPNRRYPFGHERAVSAGYVGAATALLLVGVYLLFDGGMKLAMREHPTIGGFPLFGQVVWTGWLGIAVLLWSSIPAYFLGRAKRKTAEVLHDKTLAADADINAADWQSAAAAIVGLIGVGFGLWWADSLAAVLISLEIIRSGWTELKTALGDVMDRRPLTLDQKTDDPVTDKLTEFVKRQPWIADAVVRVRERGREFTAEAHVVPLADQVSVEEISRTGVLACGVDPRLADVTIAPVKSLPDDVARARHPEEA